MEVKYKNEAFLEVGEYVCLCNVPIGTFTLYFSICVLWDVKSENSNLILNTKETCRVSM